MVEIRYYCISRLWCCKGTSLNLPVPDKCFFGMCVCVWAICIDVKFLVAAGGRWGTLQSAANEDAAVFLCNVPASIYYIVLPLGAYKLQLGGTYLLCLYYQRLL